MRDAGAYVAGPAPKLTDQSSMSRIGALGCNQNSQRYLSQSQDPALVPLARYLFPAAQGPLGSSYSTMPVVIHDLSNQCLVDDHPETSERTLCQLSFAMLLATTSTRDV